MCRKLSFFVSFVLVLCLVGNTWGMVIANQDIGSTGIAGSASEAAGVWTVEGSGGDIWGGNDAFHYVFRPMSGDGAMRVNLTSMTVPDNWTKVGVMIRETLAANSKHAIMAMTGVNGCQFVWREDTGGSSADATTGGQIAPKNLWIERDGDILRGSFWNWVILNVMGDWVNVEQIISMNEDVYIGMVVCSHNNGVLCTAEFEGPGTYIDDYTPLTPNPGSPVEWPTGAYEKPWLLMPADGAMALPLQPTLSWMPGDSATSHDVYFGTNPIPTDELSVATKALGDESYTPDTPLAEGTMYYWQIVEQPLGEESAIMSFKTERLGTGSIDYQLWYDMGGTSVSDLTGNARYPDDPDVTGQIAVLDSGTDLGDNYGGRAIGYLYPETSGDYTFWIASDDASELWLSTSGKGCEAVMLCKVSGWAGYHNYEQHATNEPDQESAPVYLEGGQKYPIWALWKEGGGGDHCSVAWEGGPDSDAPSRTEIDGYFLMPGYVDVYPSNTSPADGVTLTVQENVVSWTAGGTATSHNVYLGEDPDAMIVVATVEMPDTSATLPTLAVDTTYYWMVEADDGTDTYAGCVQSFSTAEWVSMDISTWGGSATQTGDCWTIVADGGDIWDQGDRFHFVYQTPKFTRDEGTIIAHVMSVENVGNDWAKAGVMIRETTASGSKNTAMLTTPATSNQRATFQWREQTGDWAGGSDHGDVLNPEWVKLVRNGNTFSGYHSDDGENWHHHGDHTVEMNSFVRVGLAVTSHIDGTLTTAEICDVSITTPDPRMAWGNMPECGSTGQSIHTTVGWNAGEGVASHRVYFGQDEAAVLARTTLTAELPADVTEFDPIASDRQSLMLTETYYWVVDSIMPDGTVIPGENCSFTVADYRLVDDFETYDLDPEALPEQEWVDAQLLDDGPQIVDDPERGWVLALDGDGDYVDCGNPDALNFGTGNWTICAWIKTSVTGRPKGHIIANGGDDGGGIRYAIASCENKDDKLTLICDDNASKKQSNSTTSITDGVWHHVIGLRDGDRQYVYVDGVPEDDDGLPGGYDLSGAVQHNVLLGAIWSHNGYIQKYYTGLIDDARIYDYALTEDNAKFLYDASGTPPAGGDPIANWAFEGEGDFNDSSGNGFHGTPKGLMFTSEHYRPLIVHYEFETDATDSTDNHYDGTLMDNAGIVNSVLSLDGDGDYVDCGNPTVLNFATGDWTLSAWIKNSMTGTGDGNKGGVVTNGGDGGGGHRYGLVISEQDEGKITLVTDDDDDKVQAKSDTLVNDDVWHSVIGMRKGDTIELYIDGELEASADLPAGYDLSGTVQSNVLVGAMSRASNGEIYKIYEGLIDDVHILDTALTLRQIWNLADYVSANAITRKWSGVAAASPKLDPDIAHWGNQSMRVEYTGDGAVKRIDPFGDGADPHEWSGDWTLGGTEALSIYFRGDPDNASGLMFAQLTTTVSSQNTQRVVYDGDPEDLTIPEWQEWNIKLHDLYTGKPGVPPLPEEGLPGTKIKTVGVGIIGGGSGVLHFDDLRLYPTRCVDQYAPQYDITGDCIVNEDDLRVLAGDWLDGDWTGTGLVARFEFDGDLSDSSGNVGDGTAHGAVGFEIDPVRGQVLSLPGGDDQYVSIPPVGLSGNMPTTITCWAKTNTTSIPDWTLVFGFSTEGGNCGSHFNIGNIGGPGGIGAHAWCWERTIFTDDEALNWHHYAMTFDGSTLSYYGDGVLVGSEGFDFWRRGDRVNVGKRNTQASSFNGNVDDARIYNRELSTAEVNTVMSGAEVEALYTPLVSAANLYDEEPVNSKKINFKDYALLLQQWLDEIYWP